jgi:hypothetical protein
LPPEVTTLAGAGASVVVVTGGSGASVVVVVGGGAPVVVVTGTVVVVGLVLPVGNGAPKRTRFVCDNASLNRDALNEECDPAP